MKKIMKAIGMIFILLALYYLAQFAVALIIVTIRGVALVLSAVASNTLIDVDAFANELLRAISTQTPVILLISIVLMIPTYYLFYRWRKQELRTFIRVGHVSALSVPVLVVFGIALNFVIMFMLSLLAQISWFSPVFDSYNREMDMIFGGSFALTLLAVGVVGPIFEELLFRGLVFGELRKISHVRVAIVLQALLFGVYHLNAVQGFYAIIIGLLLGYLYYRSNSIIYPMIVHITINTSSVLIGQFAGSGDLAEWGGVTVIASFILFFAAGAFILMHRSFRHTMDNSLCELNDHPGFQPPADSGPEHQ